MKHFAFFILVAISYSNPTYAQNVTADCVSGSDSHFLQKNGQYSVFYRQINNPSHSVILLTQKSDGRYLAGYFSLYFKKYIVRAGSLVPGNKYGLIGRNGNDFYVGFPRDGTVIEDTLQCNPPVISD